MNQWSIQGKSARILGPDLAVFLINDLCSNQQLNVSPLLPRYWTPCERSPPSYAPASCTRLRRPRMSAVSEQDDTTMDVYSCSAGRWTTEPILAGHW